MLKRLDIYILKEISFKLVYCLLSFIIIFIAVDIIDHIDKFIDSSMPTNAIINYYLHTIPWYISIALPMSMLIATIFTISSMARLHELTALKASGISFFRISTPFLIFGICISIFSFEFDNKIVTKHFQKRIIIEEDNEMWGPINPKQRKREIYRQLSPNKILYIKRFQHSNNIATNVSIQTFQSNNLVERVDINSMQWSILDSNWKTNNVKIKKWDEGILAYSVESNKDTIISLKLLPYDLTKESTRPREMNYYELSEFVNKMKSSAIFSPTWEVDLHFKTAFAITSFLMVLFGLSLTMKTEKINLTTGLGLSIAVIFLYYISLKMGQSIGYKGALNPFLSVWFANFLFFSIAIYLFTKIRT